MTNAMRRLSTRLQWASNYAAMLALVFSASAGAAELPVPDAMEVQALAERRDAQALQDYFQRYQRAYQANPEAERPLIQTYWALRGKTDTSLDAFYDRWVEVFPQSYEARVVRANHAWARAALIAHPRAIRGGVQSDRAWQQYRQFLQKARQDLETAQTLSSHPLVAQRSLIGVCRMQQDETCAKQVYRQAVSQAPRSLALRRVYLDGVDDRDLRTAEIAEAENQGVSVEGVRVLKAEQQLSDSRKIMRADGGTEVAIYQGIVGSVQDPWLDESAAHMYMRRNNYAEAIPLYTRALKANPNLDDALYWRGKAYFAVGDFLAAHADTMRAALIGNPQASRDLIDFHIRGEKGLPKDFSASARWCSLAAQHDQSYGAFCLGDLYANGYAGYPVDPEKSLLWMQRAADLGHQTAQHDLGVVLLKGMNDQPPDRAAGIYWLKLSSAGGFDYATNKLRMHLSRWEYFKAITWPAYRDALMGGELSFKIVMGLLIEMVRATVG